MAADVNHTWLRATLREADAIQSNPFAVLQGIAAVVNANRESNAATEFTLRALEFRGAFGPLGEAVDALARQVGLYPYLEPDSLSFADRLAYEYHRPEIYDEDIVFHRVQGQVFRHLLSGENVILSAPTSFGKSKLIDAMIALRKFKNVVVVVPTLALIDETRRRLSRFADTYKVITHGTQALGSRNLFILTAERAAAFTLPDVDFFVIDEFYKLDAPDDGSRMVALNNVFYRLCKTGAQFYMLGPNIKQIPSGADRTLKARWISTNFQTVVIEQERVSGDGDDMHRLLELCKRLSEPTIIYCASPSGVNRVANALLEAGVAASSSDLSGAAAWIAKNYHPDWVFAKAITHGIGIHHGRLPRSIGQYVVRQFNEERLRFLVCTSTLIEGVNTKAKNVVIFDNKIAAKEVDFFTFNNIRGRAGRMFHHFVGHVFLFSDPPQEKLPFVDLPTVTQNADTPASLLLQLEPSDLTPASTERLEPFVNQTLVPIDVLRENSPIPPELQLSLAESIRELPKREAALLSWRSRPSYDELSLACALVWDHFVNPTGNARRVHGISSHRQLTLKTWRLQSNTDVPSRVLDEMSGRFAASSADEAVERVMQFDRQWASFDLPRYLVALSRIQEHILPQRGLRSGSYTFFARQLESLFAATVLSALDEYGIPPAIGAKLLVHLGTDDDLDAALVALRDLDLRGLPLTAFEREIISSAQSGL